MGSILVAELHNTQHRPLTQLFSFIYIMIYPCRMKLEICRSVICICLLLVFDGHECKRRSKRNKVAESGSCDKVSNQCWHNVKGLEENLGRLSVGESGSPGGRPNVGADAESDNSLGIELRKIEKNHLKAELTTSQQAKQSKFYCDVIVICWKNLVLLYSTDSGWLLVG